MELSAELFQKVAFHERWRGYDPEEVDDFLERVGAGVGVLLDRVQEANDRINRAEARVAERADAEDAMRRTLVLAQRTADEAVAEAERRAAEIVAEAERKAGTTVAEAQARATEIEAAARARAAQTAGDAQRELRSDIADLEAARLALSTDIDALRRYLAGERDRLRSDLRRHLQIVDDPGALRMGDTPALTEVTVPDAPEVDTDHDESAPVAVDGPDSTDDDVVDDDPDAREPEPVGVGSANGASIGGGSDTPDSPIGRLPWQR